MLRELEVLHSFAAKRRLLQLLTVLYSESPPSAWMSPYPAQTAGGQALPVIAPLPPSSFLCGKIVVLAYHGWGVARNVGADILTAITEPTAHLHRRVVIESSQCSNERPVVPPQPSTTDQASTPTVISPTAARAQNRWCPANRVLSTRTTMPSRNKRSICGAIVSKETSCLDSLRRDTG